MRGVKKLEIKELLGWLPENKWMKHWHYTSKTIIRNLLIMNVVHF
jgi:hypothetical protein